MAKTQKPLLSMGARGTIADTLTFQKNRRVQIVRTKPVPTDPRSAAQLAQRQTFQAAIAAWHSLTTEEKEAWRGLCRGLTAYQCFMKSELSNVAPPPPPEEFTEEQLQHDFSNPVHSDTFQDNGQRLTISNRQVTTLGFWLQKLGSPTGDVTLRILKVSDDSVLLEKVWGDASALQVSVNYEEVTFDTPLTINEEVRILINFSGGNASNCPRIRAMLTDVKAAEIFTIGRPTSYTDYQDYDAAYRYKYFLP